MTGTSGKVAVVIPCYRAAGHLDSMLARLVPALERLERPYQLVLIDDGSPDSTWAVLEKARAQYGPALTCVRLASNIGQHPAILAAFSFLAPDAEIVVTMDDDLQHPPEAIGSLLQGLDASTDLVIAAYDRKQHDGWRNASGGLVDRALRVIYTLPRDFQLTSFRAFRRYVADHAASVKTNYPYVTAALLSATTRCKNVPVTHAPRASGSSGYNFVRSLRLAMNLYFTYSSYPLYIVLGLAVFSFGLTLALGSWVVLSVLSDGSRVPGWASLMAVVSFSNSIILMCMSVFGVYVSRFHRELTGVSGRYRVSETL